MRVVLFTGKGGVGKTTSAAATAVLAARAGHRTLVLSTDPAHSLGDALDLPLGPTPVRIAEGLDAVQFDALRRFEESWSDVRGYLVSLLRRGGLDDVAAEEVVVPPGVEEVLALLEVRALAATGAWDVLVVDCAPTAETLRLLALPAALRWYVDRLVPSHRRLAGALRPLLGRELGDLLPDDAVVTAASRLAEALADVQELLGDASTTSVRLVLTPEAVVLAETRRTFTSLALYGFAVDGVVVNRVIPDGDDPWRAGWAAVQAEHLAETRRSFAGVPIRTVPYLPREPRGIAALGDLGEALYAGDDPVAGVPAEPPMTVRTAEDARILSLALPLAATADVDLARVADDLVVTVGGHRRVLALPEALRRAVVGGAELRDGRLDIRFVLPDPAPVPAAGGAR